MVIIVQLQVAGGSGAGTGLPKSWGKKGLSSKWAPGTQVSHPGTFLPRHTPPTLHPNTYVCFGSRARVRNVYAEGGGGRWGKQDGPRHRGGSQKFPPAGCFVDLGQAFPEPRIGHSGGKQQGGGPGVEERSVPPTQHPSNPALERPARLGPLHPQSPGPAHSAWEAATLPTALPTPVTQDSHLLHLHVLLILLGQL